MDIGELATYADNRVVEALNTAARAYGYGVVDIQPESGDTWLIKVVGPNVPDGIWISAFCGDTPEEFASETFGQGFDPDDYLEAENESTDNVP